MLCDFALGDKRMEEPEVLVSSPLLDGSGLLPTAILTESGTPLFFCRSFSWALLLANSCVLQLRGFCFPGSVPFTIGFPPIKQPLALEAEALALGFLGKMGQKKETFSRPTSR